MDAASLGISMAPHIDIGMSPEGISEKKRIALSSVIAAVAITALKLFVGLQTNSLGLLSEAAHSGLDFLAALLTLLAVRVASRPPDREHQYGHGKVENLSAFVETFLLVATCAWIIWEAVDRLTGTGTHVESGFWSFAVIIVAIIVDISRARALKRVAVKYKSQALEADALHFSSDVWSSLVVLLGLVFVSLGYAWVDSVAAIIVAFLVLFVSYRLGRRTIDALMDRVPDGIYESILGAIRGVNGVEEVKSIRLRPSGAVVFVDTTVGIRRTTPFQNAHAIMDAVEKAVQESHPNVDVVVHAEPLESREETVVDKVRMIVIGRGLRPPHNLEVQKSNDRHQVAFDLEYSVGKSFVEAHTVADDLEEEIRRQLPSVDQVTIHIEEYRPGTIEVKARPEEDSLLRSRLMDFLSRETSSVACSDLHLFRIDNRYNASLTCTFDRTLTIEEVHRLVSQLETRLYDGFSELRKVTVHAEPERGSGGSPRPRAG